MPGKKPGPLRHSQGNGYIRGEDTRQRITTAAIEVFGEYGFDLATTRQIATRAGVNLPALQYYFENKEGLYHACAEYLSEEGRIFYQPLIMQVQDIHKIGREEECIELFCKLLEAILDRIFNNDNSANKRLFLARLQAGLEGPDSAYQILRERHGKELYDAALKLVVRITGRPESEELTHIRTFTLLTQSLMFHHLKKSIFESLQWDEINDPRLELLKKTAGMNCRILLKGWVAVHKNDRY